MDALVAILAVVAVVSAVGIVWIEIRLHRDPKFDDVTELARKRRMGRHW